MMTSKFDSSASGRRQSVRAYSKVPTWRVIEADEHAARVHARSHFEVDESLELVTDRNRRMNKKRAAAASARAAAAAERKLAAENIGVGIEAITASVAMYTCSARSLRPSRIALSTVDHSLVDEAHLAAAELRENAEGTAQRRASLDRWRAAARKLQSANRWVAPVNPRGGSSVRRGTFHGTYTAEQVVLQRRADVVRRTQEGALLVAEGDEEGDEESTDSEGY
jgi:hypothetical protein